MSEMECRSMSGEGYRSTEGSALPYGSCVPNLQDLVRISVGIPCCFWMRIRLWLLSINPRAGSSLPLEGGGYGSISHATAHAKSGMTIDADKDKQTDDGISVDANAERTPDGNVSTVTTNAVTLNQMKVMFASAHKKSDEQGKLVASLAKQVETLTAKAKIKNPRGATRARSGRRLDFETPSDQATRVDKDSSGQNPDETVPPGAQPTAENLPPPAGRNEGGDFERINLDIRDQSDHSDGCADSKKNWPRIRLGSTAANADRLARLLEILMRSTLSKSKSQKLQQKSRRLPLEGGGYGSISHATAHAKSGMTIDADKDKQTDDGISVDANAERTPAGNVSTVTTNAVTLNQMKVMFASAQKKSDEQGKLVASLAKQVETLTAKAKIKNPRGATRARSGRRLDFETPSDRATRVDKDSSGQNPDETVPPGAQPTAENLPPPAGSNEGGDFERIDLDIRDQSDHSVGCADVIPRRTRSQSARQDVSFENPMTEEE
ncbi:hypothetical protein F2Q69_00041722 [Brassica cretica]|uniref:Uncharacterized protein n=1 Tax=Brassica cretica TaxID=69181 RepID=A0A8S9NGW4_BRACR|nr:hypothetical protein F2Q69_00041722 [Brassica cretica]